MEHFLGKMGCGFKEFHDYIVLQQYTSINRITINNICVNCRIYTGSVFSLMEKGNFKKVVPLKKQRKQQKIHVTDPFSCDLGIKYSGF